MKMTVFCDIALCSLVEVDQHFSGAHCLHDQDLVFSLCQAHASECNEYCEEEIPADELHISESSVSPEMFLQNTQ
jgi:hypothetical protein